MIQSQDRPAFGRGAKHTSHQLDWLGPSRGSRVRCDLAPHPQGSSDISSISHSTVTSNGNCFEDLADIILLQPQDRLLLFSEGSGAGFHACA